MRRVLVVSGEPSGERHAAGLVEAARRLDAGLSFAGVGGPRLAAAGCELLHDAAELSVVGITEVVRRLPALRRVMADLSRRIASGRYDALLPVDFPDFNLLLARTARRRGVPVVYFVSPQVWAWRRGRVRTIRERVDRMIVLFRFEEAFYREHGVPVTFAGHPLAEITGRPVPAAEARRRLGWPPDAPVFGLLPGSRPAEIARH
ncbi:MAG: lipid-A-disaccharide synthase, partial [Acidobacteria bacterium]